MMNARFPARVLIADDNSDMRGYLARSLGAHWRVELATDGLAALDAARSSLPDIIVSDVMMPGLDGYALLRALREDPRTRLIPFVLLSARAGEEAVLEGLDAGADDYLVKPFSARELVARVQTHLQMARIRKEAADTERELAETRAALLADVERKNKELEAFSYSVSHDLRAPLSAINGFCQLLLAKCAAQLDEQTTGYVHRVRDAATRMGRMIDALLELSRMERTELDRKPYDLSRLALEVTQELERIGSDRSVNVRIHEGLEADVDARLVRIALENLFGNAWKFTARVAAPAIEFSAVEDEGATKYFVRDNGIGFDPAQSDLLFEPFCRLHSEEQAPGTGIGLATVQRIIERHGGRVWAEGAIGGGATFYFSFAEQPPRQVLAA